MKNKTQFLFIGFLCLIPSLLAAQTPVEVERKTVKMSQGEQQAYIVNIPETDFDEVTKDWKKIIRQNTKSKVEEVGQELVIKGTYISEIHNGSINIYSTLMKDDSAVRLVAVFEIDSVFFNFSEDTKDLHTEKTNNHITHFLRHFAVEQYRETVEEELEGEEKKLKDLNKEMNSLTKLREGYLEEIQENEQKIKNSEDVISSFEQDNVRKLDEINAKKATIASLADDPVMHDKAKDELKNFEKQKKNIENTLKKERKNIVKYNSSIEDYNRQIENNLELEEEMKAAIEAQEDVVNKVSAKLKGFK